MKDNTDVAAMRSNNAEELKKAGETANTKTVGEAKKSEAAVNIEAAQPADLKKEETKDKPLKLCDCGYA